MSYRVSSDELKFMSLLENLTGTMPKDCIIDNSKENRIIAVIQRRDLGKFIGRGGSVIRKVRMELQRDIEVVQWADTLEEFASNSVNPARVSRVEVIDRDGKKTVMLTVHQDDRGKAIGRKGRTISRAKILLKRHYGIENVMIRT
ncbi:MAG: NusA-like transcription termination signal-binding factor [Candidatus Hodarchaeales archaeon]